MPPGSDGNEMAPNNPTPTPADKRAMRVAVTLISASVVAVAIAAVCGILLLVVEPESGSTQEAVLGITAAVAGLSTAGFVIAALIYTQAKNLWRFMPAWLRVAFWIVIGVGVAITLVNLISQGPYPTRS